MQLTRDIIRHKHVYLQRDGVVYIFMKTNPEYNPEKGDLCLGRFSSKLENLKLLSRTCADAQVSLLMNFHWNTKVELDQYVQSWLDMGFTQVEIENL